LLSSIFEVAGLATFAFDLGWTRVHSWGLVVGILLVVAIQRNQWQQQNFDPPLLFKQHLQYLKN
jgi:hypothetical protein